MRHCVKQKNFWADISIFFIMAVLAGCGLVYEYLISHYAGRVLGTIETAIYGIIGIMIVAMGVGSFLARRVKCPFTGFAWLEVLIALVGSTAVLMIAGIFALSKLFPRVLAEVFTLPPDLLPQGGMIQGVALLAKLSPFVIGALLGVLIGMEIPLIARVREILHNEHLEHNAGSIYGIDYIGAGLGAAIWVLFMLKMDVTLAAALTAGANIGVGVFFWSLFRRRIRWPALLLVGHGLVSVVAILIGYFGADWDAAMEDLLYRDKVIYRMNTSYQHLTITERVMDPSLPPVLTFYLNGRTQFASNDERIYHSMLVNPALAASARQDHVLVIGGGDGLALRDVLAWNPKRVVLLDLDPAVVDFFSRPVEVGGRVVNEALLQLNKRSFSDPRVEVDFGDAFLTVETLLNKGEVFDAIVVDLPDPGHPDLNKLYSSRFYRKLQALLAGDGAMTVQSTSPYHARNAFLSIGKTVKHAGFLHVEQYHHNVPSFGEWGWTIATKNGRSARARLSQLDELPVDDGWMTRGVLLGAFEFGRHYFEGLDTIRINRLGSLVAYQYHQNDWEKEQGIYQPE